MLHYQRWQPKDVDLHFNNLLPALGDQDLVNRARLSIGKDVAHRYQLGLELQKLLREQFYTGETQDPLFTMMVDENNEKIFPKLIYLPSFDMPSRKFEFVSNENDNSFRCYRLQIAQNPVFSPIDCSKFTSNHAIPNTEHALWTFRSAICDIVAKRITDLGSAVTGEYTWFREEERCQ